jgi:hypothetical protein
MSKTRVRQWTATGACIGALLAALALSDARHLLPYAWHISDRVDFYMCWWLILGFAPWHHSTSSFGALIVLLNSGTYALLFLLIGAIVRYTQKHTSRSTSEVNNA